MADENLENIKKRVDESWKEAVQKEASANGGEEQPIEASFGLFITGLTMEALLSLGELEHPVTHKKESNFQHAKLLIDTLEMLRKKTMNNLSKDEEEALNSVLYDLRMRFVSKVNEGNNK